MTDPDFVAFAEAEQLPRGFGEADLVEREQAASVDLEQHCLDLSGSVRDEHLGARGQAFRTADVAIGTHHGHGLVLRMQPNTPDPKRRLGESRSEEHTSELQSLMRISDAVFCLN